MWYVYIVGLLQAIVSIVDGGEVSISKTTFEENVGVCTYTQPLSIMHDLLVVLEGLRAQVSH